MATTDIVGHGPLASERVLNGRKMFYLDLKENQRGRYVKITEEVGRRRDTILLPFAAAAEFLEALKRIGEFEAQLEPFRVDPSAD